MTGEFHFLCLFFVGLQWTYLCALADLCPDLYRRYSMEHTFCNPPNSKCKIVSNPIDEESIKIILNEHNGYRNKVALGQENIGPLPSAANMLHMEWDEELAKIAQKHANQCQFRHDCNECRQSKNFGAGQNLYLKYSTANLEISWKNAIKAWYDEVHDFNKNDISSFVDSDGGGAVTGHFTQLIWAESWKIGCGFVTYKEKKFYKQFYVCNYGPAGNTEDAAVYETGVPCSSCPINSCCGETCKQTEFPGLCKIMDGKAPHYVPANEKNMLFYCNFESSNRCPYKEINSQDKWKIYDSLSGSYIGVILQGGENTMLNITKTFNGEAKSCLTIYYRIGPNVAGEEYVAEAEMILTMTNSGATVDPVTVDLDDNDDLNFYESRISLTFKGFQFQVSFEISVPDGESAQYFELKDLTYTKGSCPN